MMRAARTPRPQVPLWTGKAISVAELEARRERERHERGKDGVQRLLLADLSNRFLTNGPVVVAAVPNGAVLVGGWRGWSSLQKDGARKGAADLFIGHAGRWIAFEVKRAKGVLRDEQKAFRDDCAEAGIIVRVGRGLPDCRRILSELGVFRAGAFQP
jgi:hypothetical protein